MSDNRSKESRSYNMSKIRSKDTNPEIIVRKYLFSKGMRFRKNDKRYPGNPDIVLPKYNTMIFVNGCFWHFHDRCKYAVMPSTNTSFWKKKLQKNIERDQRVQSELRSMGWNVIVVWECQLRKASRDSTLEMLYKHIVENGGSN